MLKTKEGEDPYMGERSGQSLVLLLRGTQSTDKPLLIGGFTSREMSQILHEIAGVVPKEVIIMNDQESSDGIG